MLSIICIVLAIVFLVIFVSAYLSAHDSAMKKRFQRLGIYTVGGLLVVGLLAGMFVTIDAGNRGVLLRFGKVAGVMGEGLNVKLPFIDVVEQMSVKTQLFESKASAASKDLQDVITTIAVNYKLRPESVGEVYSTIGRSYIDTIAKPSIQEVVKSITSKFNAEDLILNREEVKTAIADELTKRLAERNIIAEAVNITDFQFSEEFTKAIESKVVAVQKVLEAENKLRQVEVEARQAEQKAKGEAAAAIATAEGQGKAITIVTDAQVEANKKIAESLNKDVLQYILIDRLGKDIKVIVIPAGQNLALGDIGNLGSVVTP
jgi:prohibitin 2